MMSNPVKYFVAIITLAAVFHLWSRSTPEVAAPVVELSTSEAPPKVINTVSPSHQQPTDQEPSAPSSARKDLDLTPEISKATPHLERFSDLQIKLFRSKDEEGQLLALLNNPFILKQMQTVLLTPSLEHGKLKNQALAFVLESLKRGDSEAQKVLANLIADPIIESNQSPRPQQQLQAELKAEAMFTWSSLYPEHSSHIESLLPGPVSQKIWKNVLAQQDLNSSESDLEL